MAHMVHVDFEKQVGFTLVELVVVLLIIGILAAVALPKFSDTAVFNARGFADQVTSMLRYAQKSAVAKRRNICVQLAANTLTLKLDTADPDDGHSPSCSADLTGPAGESPFSKSAPSGVSIAGSTSSFALTPAGASSAAGDVTFTITASGESRTVTVAQQTGYVYTNY